MLALGTQRRATRGPSKSCGAHVRFSDEIQCRVNKPAVEKRIGSSRDYAVLETGNPCHRMVILFCVSSYHLDPTRFVTRASDLPAARDAARTPMVGLMLGYVIRAGKEFHQHKPGYEPTDVSPESDAAALSADRNQATDKLD